MLLRLIRKVRNWCDAYIQKRVAATWVGEVTTDGVVHNDPYCQYCGYLCDRCGRPY